MTKSNPPGNRQRGLSLIECCVAITVMGTIATMYAAAWNNHRGQNDAAREIEIATVLFLRQVERIKQHSPREAPGTGANMAPFTETTFQQGSACPPARPTPAAGQTHYVFAPAASHQLHPPVRLSTVLTSANAFQIPATHPWMLPLPVELADPQAGGYSITVLCMRVCDLPTSTPITEANLNAVSSHLHQLVKYQVRIDRTIGGDTRSLLQHEFLQEVR